MNGCWRISNTIRLCLPFCWFLLVFEMCITVTNWLQCCRTCRMITTPFNCTPISSSSLFYQNESHTWATIPSFFSFFSVKRTDWPFGSSIKVELLQNFQHIAAITATYLFNSLIFHDHRAAAAPPTDAYSWNIQWLNAVAILYTAKWNRKFAL